MKQMKRILAMAAILTAVVNTGFVNDSHALVGVAFKSRPVKVIGAVGAVTGGIIGLYGYATAVTATTLATAFGGAILTGYGVIIAGVGLVILDEKQVADIEFKAIDPNQPQFYPGFTREQVETYNSELAQLNSIRQTMIAESNDEADTSDAEVLWKTYSSYLNSDTVKIAQANAANFLKAIR